MSNIIIKPSNNELSVNEHETILDAGIKHQLNLPHGCKNGDCGACKCKILSGQVSLAPYSKKALSDIEIEEGYTLLCRAFPVTNVELEIPHLNNNIPIRVLPSKVSLIERINDCIILKLRLPEQVNFKFDAGQYIEILLKDKNRSYSLANLGNNNEIELHIRYYSGGAFSEFVWNKLKVGDLIRFRGPLGNFGMRDSEKPAVFVCTGTGFAPIKAILEQMIEQKSTRIVGLYWGNQMIADFYLLEFITYAKTVLNLTVNLCLSRDKSDGYYSGYVTDAILSNYSDLTNHEVYACGNSDMIESLYNLTTSRLNLEKINFLSDVFTPAPATI